MRMLTCLLALFCFASLTLGCKNATPTKAERPGSASPDGAATDAIALEPIGPANVSDDPLGETNLLQQEVRILKLRRQAVAAEFNALMDLAQRQIAARNIPGALDTVSQARFLINRHDRFLSASEQARMHRIASDIADRIAREA